MYLSRQQAISYLSARKKDLLVARKRRIRLTASWKNGFPQTSGVYAIYENSVLVYVGESESLRKRMGNLRDSRQHVLRRHLGKALFSTTPGYIPATARVAFPMVVENLINNHIKRNLTVAILKLRLGRKELEERFTRGSPKPKYNLR